MTTAHFENIKSRIIEQLLKAEKSVKVISAYFSDKGLFEMLCKLANKGLDVELIIADEPINTFDSKIKYSEFIDSNGKLYLANRNPVQTLVHHKFCLIDDKLIMTGSFNWTTKASLNRENVIIVDDEETAQEFVKEFNFVKEEYSKIFTNWEEVIVPCGFTGIDRITNGFKPGELICLTGKSGMGKTNLLINVSLKVSGEFNIPIGYINSDFSSNNFSFKLMSLASEVQIHKLKTGKLEDYEWHQVHKATEKLKEYKFYFQEGGIPIDELERKVKILWYKGAKLIIIDKIDYLLFKMGDELDNDNNREILGRLKSLSRLLRVPIIFVTEININEGRFSLSNSRRPMLSNIGIIRQYADSVLSIHREEYFGIYEDEFGGSTKGKTEVSILKHMFGITGDAILSYDSITGNFRDIEEEKGVEIDPEILKNKMGNEDEMRVSIELCHKKLEL